jgi:hypothetical protein
MEEAEKKPRTPEEFFDALDKTLQAKEGFDKDLAKILRQHILVAKPGGFASQGARGDLLKLAEDRAVPKSEASGDGK